MASKRFPCLFVMKHVYIYAVSQVKPAVWVAVHLVFRNFGNPHRFDRAAFVELSFYAFEHDMAFLSNITRVVF